MLSNGAGGRNMEENVLSSVLDALDANDRILPVRGKKAQ